MADDRKPEPPCTLEAWLRFVIHCETDGKPEWLPSDENLQISWPEFDWTGDPGPSWFSTAPDHPFQGRSFCWRCLAEAQGFTAGAVPHCTTDYVTCWGPAESSSGDGDQDSEQAVGTVTSTYELPDGSIGATVTVTEVGQADEIDYWSNETDNADFVSPPVPGLQHTDGTPVRIRPQAVDTGTFFYTPPER
jgi:hypothetical protein